MVGEGQSGQRHGELGATDSGASTFLGFDSLALLRLASFIYISRSEQLELAEVASMSSEPLGPGERAGPMLGLGTRPGPNSKLSARSD